MVTADSQQGTRTDDIVSAISLEEFQGCASTWAFLYLVKDDAGLARYEIGIRYLYRKYVFFISD